MKVVLINPALEMNNACWFPIGLGYIASVLRRAGFEVELIDIIGEGLSRKDFQTRLASVKADAFGIGGIVTAYNNAVDAASYIRAAHPGAFIFAGNTVAYSIPELLLKTSEVSAIVLGEGEMTAAELMKAVRDGRPLTEVKGLMFKGRNGELVNTGERPPIENIDELPLPAWDLMPMERYFRNAKTRYCVISTVRGCPFSCTYCCKTFMGYRIRYRTPKSIMNELLVFNEKYGMDVFHFFDDLSTVNKSRMLEFCGLKMDSALKKVKWTITARVNLVDDELIKALKGAGCSQISFGFESMDQKILDSINKKVTVEQNEQALALCEKHDMDCGSSSFMVGYIDESEEQMRRSAEFCRKHYLRYEPHYMTPFPGTELYRYSLEKGLIKNELEYLRELSRQGNTDYLLLNITKEISDAELTALRAKYLYYTSPYREKGRLSPRKLTAKLTSLLNLPPKLLAETVKRKFLSLTGFKTKGSGGSASAEQRYSNIWE